MADYQLGINDTVIRTADQCSIPPDPDNRLYVEYLAWVAAGGVPDPYVPPPYEPPLEDGATGAARANARLDAGVVAALAPVIAARDALHAVPSGFNASNYAQVKTHLNVLSDAVVALVQGLATPPP